LNLKNSLKNIYLFNQQVQQHATLHAVTVEFPWLKKNYVDFFHGKTPLNVKNLIKGLKLSGIDEARIVQHPSWGGLL
jgi:hypothetical protein